MRISEGSKAEKILVTIWSALLGCSIGVTLSLALLCNWALCLMMVSLAVLLLAAAKYFTEQKAEAARDKRRNYGDPQGDLELLLFLLLYFFMLGKRHAGTGEDGAQRLG